MPGGLLVQHIYTNDVSFEFKHIAASKFGILRFIGRDSCCYTAGMCTEFRQSIFMENWQKSNVVELRIVDYDLQIKKK